MAYTKTKWVDHVLDGEGKVVQQGTPVNAENLNKIEDGLENSVSKDGGDTITKGVKFKSLGGTSGGGISSTAAGVFIAAYEDVSVENGDRIEIIVANPSSGITDTAFQMRVTRDGKSTVYPFLHTGNKNKITPADIGAATASHNHSASNINSGTLGTARLPTVPVEKGGTGATTAQDAFKSLANSGAIISLNNDVTRYTSDSDSTETLFNNWLDSLMQKMPELSSVFIVFRCNPVLGGSTYYGVLNKHTQEFATITANTYGNDKTCYLHKVKSTSWKSAQFLYQEIKPADIGAAPTGFGLGEYSKFIDSSTNLDNVTSNGWYAWATDKPVGADFHYCTMFVATLNHNQVTQIVYVQEEKNTTLQRTRISGVWYPWECTSKRYGTADLTAGTSPLRNGELYLVYE